MDSLFLDRDERIKTFQDWQYTEIVHPQKLASAGFYYEGINDTVRCFACGLFLNDWNVTDNPWMRHTDGYMPCFYLISVKGSSYIEQCRLCE
jgi:Inhibitor of Apoptosis domain